MFARIKENGAWIVEGYNHFENIHAPNKKLDNGNYCVTFTAREEERIFFRPGRAKQQKPRWPALLTQGRSY